jgi:uncharacterized protein involved in oxidation of intracellular sulfur
MSHIESGVFVFLPMSYPKLNGYKKSFSSERTMKVLFIISTDEGETIYNAIRLANVAVKKGDEVSVFMLGKGVLFEKSGNEEFNVLQEVNQFEGDFYV